MKVVLATRNIAKMNMYSSLFHLLGVETSTPDSYGIFDSPEETGLTSEENVLIKVAHYQINEVPVFCEDVTLYVPWLNDNVLSSNVRALYGTQLDDENLIIGWEHIVASLKPEERSGAWHVAYALSYNSHIFVDSHDFWFTFFLPASQKRIVGKPMSSIIGPSQFGKPESELSEEEYCIYIQEHNNIVINILKSLLENVQ